jgi:hypothetical protein
MLWSHAYCAVIARDARNACVRVANGLEVGRRARRHTLFRSPRAGSDESRHQQQQSSGYPTQRSKLLHSTARSDARSVSRFRNFEASRGRGFQQFRRGGPSRHSIEFGTPSKPQFGALPRWTLSGRISRKCHAVLAKQHFARRTHAASSHHRWKWARNNQHECRSFQRTSAVNGPGSSRSCAQTPTQAAASLARTLQQAISWTADVRQAERPAFQARSTPEHTHQGLIVFLSCVDRSTGVV